MLLDSEIAAVLESLPDQIPVADEEYNTLRKQYQRHGILHLWLKMCHWPAARQKEARLWKQMPGGFYKCPKKHGTRSERNTTETCARENGISNICKLPSLKLNKWPPLHRNQHLFRQLCRPQFSFHRQHPPSPRLPSLRLLNQHLLHWRNQPRFPYPPSHRQLSLLSRGLPQCRVSCLSSRAPERSRQCCCCSCRPGGEFRVEGHRTFLSMEWLPLP
uniref:Uncharacterized protein n=1 Tax=Sphaerodactylus townsendi TaxID=933632 RepID=A0ACB8E8W8_9SAUR